LEDINERSSQKLKYSSFGIPLFLVCSCCGPNPAEGSTTTTHILSTLNLSKNAIESPPENDDATTHVIGDDGTRTHDIQLAKLALSQLSYVPEPRRAGDTIVRPLGPGRLELPTSRLSGVRSSQLSYEPFRVARLEDDISGSPTSVGFQTHRSIHFVKSKKNRRCINLPATQIEKRDFTHFISGSQVEKSTF
jgi:hypothetical protein